MIEIYHNLYIGSDADERSVRGKPDWFIVSACKEPHHRKALGYTGPAAPKTHPEYLIAHRPNQIILNLVDSKTAEYIPDKEIGVALAAIHEHIQDQKVLIHCNAGQSRAPTLGLLYLVRYTPLFDDIHPSIVLSQFQRRYPPYSPAQGMKDYAETKLRSRG